MSKFTCQFLPYVQLSVALANLTQKNIESYYVCISIKCDSKVGKMHMNTVLMLQNYEMLLLSHFLLQNTVLARAA